MQMPQSQLGGAALVEHHVGCALDLAMPGYYHHRQRQALLQHRIDQDKPFDRPVHQQARVLVDQVRLAAMTGREVKVSFLNQELLHAGQHLRGIVVAELGNQHADRVGLPLAQRARKKARPVVEFSRSLGHPIPRFLRNRLHARRVVQHQRNGRRRQVQIFAQRAQADRLPRRGLDSRFSSCRHALLLITGGWEGAVLADWYRLLGVQGMGLKSVYTPPA